MTSSLTQCNFPSDGRMIILPGDQEWDYTLTQPPPDWQKMAAKDPDGFAFVVEPESGIARVATSIELEDYLYGGEYDERLAEIGMTDEWDG